MQFVGNAFMRKSQRMR